MTDNNVTDLDQYKEEIENLKQDYQDMYNDLIDSSKSVRDAVDILRHMQQQEPDYWRHVEPVEVQVSFTVGELADYGWHEKNKREKAEMLWEIGINTRTGRFYQDLRRKMVGTKIEWCEVVWGAERLDKGWLTKRRPDYSYYASDDARELARFRADYGYKEMVRSLGM